MGKTNSAASGLSGDHGDGSAFVGAVLWHLLAAAFWILETIEELIMGISTLSDQISRVEKIVMRLDKALADPNLSSDKQAAAKRAMRGAQLLLKQRIERQRTSKP